MQNEIINTIKTAFAAQDARYKQNPKNAQAVEKLGTKMQPDIQAGLATFLALTPGQVGALAKLGIDWGKVSEGLSRATNVKVARRLPQFVAFIISGDARYLQGSAQTALLEYCALCIGAKTKEALRFASTGKGDENTSDQINVSKARTLRNAFGEVKSSSRDTQASVSFSKGGLLDILGLVTPWAKGDTMPTPVDCKLSRALNSLVNSATESQIELWAATAKKGKK